MNTTLIQNKHRHTINTHTYIQITFNVLSSIIILLLTTNKNYLIIIIIIIIVIIRNHDGWKEFRSKSKTNKNKFYFKINLFTQSK